MLGTLTVCCFCAGVVTQGRTAHGQYVTHYKVQVSDNGRNFRWVDGGRVMRANSGSNNHKKTNKFRKRVSARYVRIVVWHWRGHISMRAAVITCGGAVRRAAKKAGGSKKKGSSKCKTDNVSYSRSRASSVYSNNRIGHSHGKGRLDSNQAWSARHNRRGQWWQMDLGSRKSVGGRACALADLAAFRLDLMMFAQHTCMLCLAR